MKALEINKKDLMHNINTIKNILNSSYKDLPSDIKKCEIIAVVKNNGYGMGLIEYVKMLIDEGIKFFAVSTIEEALEIRNAKIKEKLLMLSPVIIKSEAKELIENNVILTISSKKSAEIANKIAEENGRKIKVHIKIDTGFGRYGFVYNNPLEIVEVIQNNKNLEVEGCFSHFSQSYEKKNKWTSIQYNRFLDAIANLQQNKIQTGMLHICNSSAFLKYPYMKLNAVRIGSAFTGRISITNLYGLKNIGILKSSISEIKAVDKGFNIGYSNTYKTKENTNIAIVPVGYADGINITVGNDSFRVIDHIRYIYNDFKNILKGQKNNLYVKLRNKKYRIIGKVGLYHIVVDIKKDSININDIVYVDVKPIYVPKSIRREYLNE
ncbi:MAG: alanine racemase [Oscillospiraceae bacterium]|nr:alanine racemase [Oscillospiraceae bacterium]